jgi:hypothetical protein
MPFDFVSHDEFPEDKYIKEVVYLCLDGKHRVGYVKKIMQNGGMFWDVISTSATKGESRVNLKGYITDSNFLHEDIMHFLKTRGWEKGVRAVPEQAVRREEVAPNGDLPF